TSSLVTQLWLMTALTRGTCTLTLSSRKPMFERWPLPTTVGGGQSLYSFLLHPPPGDFLNVNYASRSDESTKEPWVRIHSFSRRRRLIGVPVERRLGCRLMTYSFSRSWCACTTRISPA